MGGYIALALLVAPRPGVIRTRVPGPGPLTHTHTHTHTHLAINNPWEIICKLHVL